jgi:hypothetical protein
MADDTTQRAAHRFFVEHLQTLEPFTKADIQRVTGWADAALGTYWSKQFKNILEPVGAEHWRVRERFRLYLDWKKFKNLVTQVKTAPPSYAPTVYEEVVVYEFYMPLSHEGPLKVTLDTLFYKDVIFPRLRRIGIQKLKAHFEYLTIDSDESFLEKVCKFVDGKFAGYSIYHVDGRFRAGDLLTQDKAFESTKAGTSYLVNETTAVTRFVFPCKDKKEADTVRFLFKELFMDPITEQVSGEDQIWVVESGSLNRVQVWKPRNM